MTARTAAAGVMLAAFAVICLPVHAAAGVARQPPWRQVEKCSIILVGAVVDSASPDSWTFDRTSKLAVDHTLYGDAASGDTLLVSWEVPTRVSGGIDSEMSPSGPNLDKYVGTQAMWFLFRSDGGRLSALGAPVALIPEHRNRLEALVEALQVPLDDVQGRVKIDIVTAYFKGYLDGLLAGRGVGEE